MNIAQLSEKLKDVPQDKLINYAQNPNSVVPQFLALAEIQRRQRLQSAASGEAPQSSVAEDIMAQAQPPMGGVAELPTRAMFTEQGMAGGGIVAFASGGELDDDELEDYYDNREQAEALSMSAKLRSMLAQMPPSYEKAMAAAGKSARPSVSESRQTATQTDEQKGNHKYEDLVIAEAKRQGIDPALARHILYKETGNLPNPESARSRAGAIGIMQLMPKTAKELGVDPTDPEQNIRGGITYLRKMMDKYNDPVLAAAAYNAGPGRVDKALKGEGLTALPRETRMYIAGLAEGGAVKHYDYGGSVQMEMGPTDAELGRTRAQSFQNEDITLLREELKRQMDRAKKAGDEDKYAALMQAGFAMMAGTSPYAMANIGQGALAGAGAFAASKKAQAEAERDILKTRLGLAKATTSSETARQNRELIEESRQSRLDLSKKRESQDIIETAERNFNQNPVAKKIATQLQDLTPDNPLYEYYLNEIERLRNNAYANAGVPGYSIIPKPAELPKQTEKPGFFDRFGSYLNPFPLGGKSKSSAAPAGGTGEWSIKPKQ